MHKNLRPDGATNNVEDEYIANLEKDCKANTIELAVSADGSKYTVAIAANGHKRTFETKKK